MKKEPVMEMIYEPKKSEGLIKIPEHATLRMIIEFMNDCNFNISGDKELEAKWKHWMPNAKMT